MGSDHVAMANCVTPKVANELRVLKCQSRNAVSICKHWRGPGEVLVFSMITLCEALNIYKYLLIYFLCCCNSFTILIFILQIQTQQSIMAESLIYKPRMDLSNNILFRLSLYYVSTFPSFSSHFGTEIESQDTIREQNDLGTPRRCLPAPFCASNKQC